MSGIKGVMIGAAVVIAALTGLCAVALAFGGSAAAETVESYLNAQMQYDHDAAADLVKQSQRDGAREELKAKFAADKEAGAKLKSFEVTGSETEGDMAAVTVKATRLVGGEEKTREETFVLARENGTWNIDKSSTDLLNWSLD
ncbi:MAG: DUF4878 domain-containing protein [Planctomycetes bacterium]|nr:DUF4878 domain-containing protein [Planctomycetota bacterium]